MKRVDTLKPRVTRHFDTAFSPRGGHNSPLTRLGTADRVMCAGPRQPNNGRPGQHLRSAGHTHLMHPWKNTLNSAHARIIVLRTAAFVSKILSPGRSQRAQDELFLFLLIRYATRPGRSGYFGPVDTRPRRSLSQSVLSDLAILDIPGKRMCTFGRRD